ncbi:hypothetical protein CSC73_14000 [Pseudoxanthomonas sacheonensis]|nr:hypothetical protein CSC73_14000 [Pseudoxanthomonas sacheonensis]
MVVLPSAAMALTAARGQYRIALWMGLGFTAFAAAVMAYSNWQVRRGRWSHVDASGKSERRSLNRFLFAALLAAAACAAWSGFSAELTLGLCLSAAMVATAMLTSRWCKLSLHMAFAVFAALLLMGASLWVGVAALCFAGAVAWSRLVLRRHVPRDLVAGTVAGAFAGIVFALAAVAGAG